MELFGYQIEKYVFNNFVNNDTIDNLISNVDDKTRSILESIKNKDDISSMYNISKDGQNVGFIEFRDINTNKPKIGIEIEECFRRKGIAYMLLRELMRIVSNEREIEYFVYQVREENQASIRLVEKLGGVFQNKISIEDVLSLCIYHIVV